MLNEDKVVDYIKDKIKNILDAQSPYSWCDDDANRELLWDHEQDISDYNNDEDEDKDFYSQHGLSLDEAEQAVKDISTHLRNKWDLNLSFIKVRYVSTHNNYESNLIFGWHIEYCLETSIDYIDVKAKTKGIDIEIKIESKDRDGRFPKDFDLYDDFSKYLMMDTLKS